MTQRKEVNIEIKQGATWEMEVKYSDPETGEPKPITGYHTRMQCRNQGGDILHFTLSDEGESDGEVVIDGEAGSVKLKLPASFTADLVWDGLAYYDVFTFNGDTIEESSDSMAEVGGAIKLLRRYTQ